MSRLRHAKSQRNGQNSIRPENIDPDDHIKKLQEINNAKNQKDSVEKKQNDAESDDIESDDELDSAELDNQDDIDSDDELDDAEDNQDDIDSDDELDDAELNNQDDIDSDDELDDAELDNQDDIESNDKPDIFIIAPSSRRKNTDPNPEEQIRIVPTKDTKTYPIITSSSFEEPYIAANNEKIVETSYTAIGTTAVAIASSVAKLYYSCAEQLGIALGFTQAKGNAQLVQRIMNQNILTFLSMNEESLGAISGVGNKLGSLMNFYNPFISNAIVAEKSFNTVTDFGKLLHKPNADNIIKLAVDFIDTVGTYYSSPYTAILPISNAGYLAYKGEYTQAGEQIIMAASYTLPLIMTPAHPAALAVVTGIGIATTYNLYTALNDYKNDAENIDSITSYTELYKIIPESIFNTSEKMQELESSIHNNNKIIEKANLKKIIDTQGDFGSKLAKHIYLPMIEEKYELLNQVSQGKITQEEADQLQTKHFAIELENRIYDHCIEVKNQFYDPGKDYYHCYILDNEILDRVIIGENNTVEKVELEA